LDFEFSLSLGLVDILLEADYVIARLLCLLGELVLLSLKRLIDGLDLIVELLLSSSQLFKLLLVFETFVNLIFEICILLVFLHFFDECLSHNGKLTFVSLDQLLVALNIW